MRNFQQTGSSFKLYPKHVIDDLLMEFSKNRSIRDVCADPKYPSVATVYRWLSEDRDFAAAYAEAVKVSVNT